MNRARVRVVTLLAALTVAWLVPVAPASAHGRGSDATNFRSRVLEVPEAQGLQWRILGGDEQLELRNSGPHEVIVLGHEGEPYLRIAASGAYENRRSPTVALHRERFRTELPDGVAGGFDAEAEPEWVRVSGQPRWSWHDHRIHWMSPQAPAAQGETVLIPRWEVPVRIDGRAAVVAGELRWIPPTPWPPWVLAGLAGSAVALAGLRHRPPPRPDGEGDNRADRAGGGNDAMPAWPAALRPAALVVAGVALLNTVHLVEDLAAAVPLQVRLFSAGQTLLYLVLAVAGSLRARRGDYAGATALAVGSGALFLGQGLLYLPVLGASQISTTVPDGVLRLAVGASLAQLLPVGVVLWRAGREVQPVQATSDS